MLFEHSKTTGVNFSVLVLKSAEFSVILTLNLSKLTPQESVLESVRVDFGRYENSHTGSVKLTMPSFSGEEAPSRTCGRHFLMLQ